MEANNAKAMYDALIEIRDLCLRVGKDISPLTKRYKSRECQAVNRCFRIAVDALAAPPHTGKWVNGSEYEYEYAYCSVCGYMQFADWDSHRQAEEGVISFADNYKFCPSCGAKMEGGVYVK